MGGGLQCPGQSYGHGWVGTERLLSGMKTISHVCYWPFADALGFEELARLHGPAMLENKGRTDECKFSRDL